MITATTWLEIGQAKCYESPMENRRWLLSRTDGAELEIIHDGFHVRAKPKGERWSNQTFPTPDEAGEAIDAWLGHLFETGWTVAAEGADAELVVLWNRIAEHPKLELEEGLEEGAEHPRDESWLKIRMISDVLEPFMADAVAEKISTMSTLKTLQLTNRKLLIDFSPFVDALTLAPPQSVTRLIIDTLEQPLSKQARFPWGDLGIMLTSMPKLEFAFLAGDIELGMLTSSSLKSLRIAGDPLLPGTIEELAMADLPSLRDLVLGLAVSEPAEKASLRALESILDAGKFPSLERIQLTGVENPAELMKKLAGKPLLSQLKTFQISGSELEDEDTSVPLLLEVATELAAIEILGLGTDVLSEEAQEKLAAAIPGLVDDFELEDAFLPEGLDAWATDERLEE